jgi:hypothetical protein
MVEAYKPLFNWDIQVFKKSMNNLGYEVEFLDKPKTIEGILFDDSCVVLDKIDKESKEVIQKYLEDSKADGGLIIDSNKKDLGYNRAKANLTIALYILKPCKK